jgi:hypothetical protein
MSGKVMGNIRASGRRNEDFAKKRHEGLVEK